MAASVQLHTTVALPPVKDPRLPSNRKLFRSRRFK